MQEYELLEELGNGGMGRVHRARHTVNGRIVAIKSLHPHLVGSDEAQRRFEREIKSCTKLAHPAIIEILDAFGPGQRLRRLVDEMSRAPGRVSGALEVERRDWATRLADGLTSAGVREALEAFEPVRDAYYRSDAVGGADKQALHALVDEMVDLEAAVERAQVDVAIPGRRLQSPEYGPLTGEAAPLEGTMIALDPGFTLPELKMEPGSRAIVSAESRYRMRTMGEFLGAPARMVDMLSTAQYAPRETLTLPPGPVELRASIAHHDRDNGVRVLVAQRPEQADAAWRLLARVRSPNADPVVVRHAIPANVLPSGSFALRFQLAHCGMLAVMTGEMRQGGRLMGLGIGRR